MKKVYFTFFCIICGFLISCASTPTEEMPEWVLNTNSVFPQEEYIARIGEGFSKTEALAKAELELAKYFGQTVQSTVSGKETWVSKSSNENLKDEVSNTKEINDEFSISVNIDLVGVEKTKPWFNKDSDSYFVCAYINRQKAFELYLPTIVNAQNQFYSLYNGSIEEKDFFKKVNLLEESKKSGENYIKTLNFAQVILPTVFKMYEKDINDVSSIDLKIKKAQNDAALKISVINDYDSKLYDFISQVISDCHFLVSDTDYEYIVSVVVNENEMVDNDSGIIVVEPSVTIIVKNKESSEISFTYTRDFDQLKAYYKETVDKKAWKLIEGELRDSFVKEFKEFLRR